MLIGVDIDGVLYPWEEVVRDVVRERFDIELPTMAYWDAYKDALGSERWAWLWTREGSDAMFGQVGRIYPGVADAITALLKSGRHDVHFVTHRDPRRTAVHTATFLALHFGRHPWGGVHVLRNGMPKRRLARWDVFVDDKPETCWDFLANSNAKVFTPVRPWNTELDEEPDVTRYVHPEAIVRWVERYS